MYYIAAEFYNFVPQTLHIKTKWKLARQIRYCHLTDEIRVRNSNLRTKDELASTDFMKT